MTCYEIKRKIYLAPRPDLIEMPDVRAHVENCVECHRIVAGEQLSALIIKAGVENEAASAPSTISPFLMARIRNRVRELSDQGAGSWDSAILALRGWLLAFGTAAIILLLLSVQWRTTPERALMRDHEAELSAISNVNEVLLSGKLARQAKTDNEAIRDVIDE